MTTGRNGDGGRSIFCRFLAATSTYWYALTPYPFPAVQVAEVPPTRRDRTNREELSIGLAAYDIFGTAGEWRIRQGHRRMERPPTASLTEKSMKLAEIWPDPNLFGASSSWDWTKAK